MNEILVGTIQSAVQLQGEVNETKNMGGSFDLYELPINAYDGVYMLTPNESTQTLATQNKSLLSNVTVNPIPSEYVVPSGTTEITSNGSYDVKAYAGASVNVPIPSGYIVPTGTLSITSNGTTDVTQYADVDVSVTYTLQDKSVTPTESVITVSADVGYDGLNEVEVDAISSTYVGSDIPLRDDTDLSVSGATVSVPSGYYASAETKTVSSGTEGTPFLTKSTVSGYAVTITPVVTNTAGYISGGTHAGTFTSVSASELVSGTLSISANASGVNVTNYASVDVNVPAPSPSLQSKSKSYTPTESAITESISADVGYDGLSKVDISIGAVSSTYVGSGIPTHSASDMTQSGKNVTAPSGYYASNATYSMSEAQGVMSISINSSGLITASHTFTGAGYQASGSTSKTQQMTTQSAQTIYPSVSDRTISASTYLTGTQTIKAVTTTNLSAANIKNGVTIQVGDSADSDRIASVTGTYEGGGSSKNVQVVQSTTRTNASTLTAVGSELTVSKSGTYHIYWSAFRTNTSASYTWGTQLYIGGTAYGSENTTWTNNQQNNHLQNITLTANQKLRVYGRNTRGTSYYICAPMLCIVEA